MTVLRLLLYMLAAWLGGVWVALAADAVGNGSWGAAIPMLIGIVALAAAITVVLHRDVNLRRVRMSRRQ